MKKKKCKEEVIVPRPTLSKTGSVSITRRGGNFTPQEFTDLQTEINFAILTLLADGAKDVTIQVFSGGSGRLYVNVVGKL